MSTRQGGRRMLDGRSIADLLDEVEAGEGRPTREVMARIEARRAHARAVLEQRAEASLWRLGADAVTEWAVGLPATARAALWRTCGTVHELVGAIVQLAFDAGALALNLAFIAAFPVTLVVFGIAERRRARAAVARINRQDVAAWAS